jgi:hypothetical protein
MIPLASQTGNCLSPSEWATSWMTDIVGRFQVRVTDFDLLQSAKTSSGVPPGFLERGAGVSLQGVKRPKQEAYHSNPSNAEVQNEWSFAFTPTYAVITCANIMLHLHLQKHYCALKLLNKIQYTAAIPNSTKHKSLISLRQTMLLSRYFVTHCVTKTDACRTRGKVLATVFRKEIDVSSHIKMTCSTYLMQDHVTSQV